MSKLEELIQKLCTKGVVYKRLGETCKIETGKLNANSAVNGGEYAFFTTAKEVSRIDTYRWDTEALLIAGNANVGDVKHYVGKFEAYQRTYVLTEFDKNINVRFLYYSLCNNLKTYLSMNKNEAAMTYIVLGTLENFMIPVPPIEVQHEIVRILDNFTELTAELTTELTARKKQYEFYRDELLVSDNSNKTIKLSDLFDIRNGYTPSKDNPEFWDNGTIPWFRLEDINDNGRILYDSYQHISDKALKRNGLFKDNSIIISTSATIGEYALIKVPFLCNQRFACLTIKDEYKNNFSIEFLYHYCPLLSQYCKNHLNKGNFASVDMTKFGDFLFPILDLNEQQRIVDILDKFDAYCNDLSIGLPAEIAARQKQYEYYRDKLLTFKELQA